MKLPRADLDEPASINLVENIVINELGWIFRNQPENDYGIDAHIEVRRDGHATGRLIALQIRSGASRFTEETPEGFVHRDTVSHLNYWLNHSLPVVLVLCNLTQETCYWVQVTQDAAQMTSEGRWKIVVPKRQILGPASLSLLTAVAEKRPDLTTLLLRPARLAGLARESRARCIARWEAAGIPADEAASLADDVEVGLPGQWYSDHMKRPLVILLGEIGIGKSLIADRWFQAAILAAQEDVSAPVPVHLGEANLSAAAGRLKDAVLSHTEGIGDPTVQGAKVVLDGLDEAGEDYAARLLDGARALVHAWPETAVLVTSRPSSSLMSQEEAVMVPPLARGDAFDLVERSSGGRNVEQVVWSLPQSIREAICYPLFAILLGVLLRDRTDVAPRSTGEMISDVVDLALRGATSNVRRASTLLERLAVLVTERNGPVAPSEIGTSLELQPLLDSRLIVDRAGVLSFSLSIFAEWFAAQGLAAGHPTPQEILYDPRQLERWRYPLVILTSTGNHDTVSTYLAPLAREHPAFAGEVIRDGLAKKVQGRTVPLPPAHECGRRLRAAMSAWIDGIGPLASLIAPLASDGSLQPVAVGTSGNLLTAGWYWRGDKSEEIIPIDVREVEPGREHVDYDLIEGGEPTDQSAWAWQWTHRQLTKALTRLIRQRALRVARGPLATELAWKMAQRLANVASQGEGISLALIEDRIEAASHEQSRGTDQPSHMTRRSRRLGVLRSEVARLRASGATELSPPWPGPDIDKPVTPRDGEWSRYSDEALVRRAYAVIRAAMDGYRELITTWFPRFAERLQLATLMPAKLVGGLSLPQDRGEGYYSGPSVEYYFEALPFGAANSVTLRVGEMIVFTEDLFHAMLDNRRSLRPQAVWLSASATGQPLDVFGPDPATQLAYGWLFQDLREVSWVDEDETIQR
jgi:hypothetical protein